MWWVVPVRKPAWAIYSLCSPELDRLTAGPLAAAAAASVFVSNTSRDNPLHADQHFASGSTGWLFRVTPMVAQEGLKLLFWSPVSQWVISFQQIAKIASNIRIVCLIWMCHDVNQPELMVIHVLFIPHTIKLCPRHFLEHFMCFGRDFKASVRHWCDVLTSDGNKVDHNENIYIVRIYVCGCYVCLRAQYFPAAVWTAQTVTAT